MAGVSPPRRADAGASLDGTAIRLGISREERGQYILQGLVPTLALDTSTAEGSVALRRDGAIVIARAGDPSHPHGVRLPGDLFAALEQARLTLADVTLLAVGLGPGPFTGLRVGLATIDGTQTQHYAFREAGTDWEVWIQQGDQPLPRKLVIVDTTDPARPTFTTRLTWQVNPTFTDADFAFVPDANAKRIELATYKGTEK